MAENKLVITRTFNAPVESVWKAWTDPELLKKWNGPKDYICQDFNMDFRVGGKYLNSMQGPDGKKIWGTGTYLEIIPNKKIVCTDSFADENGNPVTSDYYGMPGMPLEMKITVTFEEDNGKTKMTLEHEGLPAGEHQKGASAGWNSSLDKLEKILKD